MLTEISIKQSGNKFLTRLFASQPCETSYLLELIGRFHTRSTSHPNTLFATFNDSELELIIDGLTDRFISAGLREDSEPNTLGLQIEEYIDVFNAPVLKQQRDRRFW